MTEFVPFEVVCIHAWIINPDKKYGKYPVFLNHYTVTRISKKKVMNTIHFVSFREAIQFLTPKVLRMLDRYNDFCEVASLNKTVTPWLQRRRNGKIYGQFMVVSEGVGQWFAPFVGLEFMAEIVFEKNEQGKRRVKEVVPVRMTQTYVTRGRVILGQFVAMI